MRRITTAQRSGKDVSSICERLTTYRFQPQRQPAQQQAAPQTARLAVSVVGAAVTQHVSQAVQRKRLEFDAYSFQARNFFTGEDGVHAA